MTLENQPNKSLPPAKRSKPSRLECQLAGYRLTTAEILYHMPDHPTLLQSFVWQLYDITPDYPEVHKFLKFWQSNIDGPLHSVRVGSCQLITPGETKFADVMLTLH